MQAIIEMDKSHRTTQEPHLEVYLGSSILVIGHQFVVDLTLLLRHQNFLQAGDFLWQVGQYVRLQPSQEKRFHDPLGVSDPVFLIICPGNTFYLQITDSFLPHLSDSS